MMRALVVVLLLVGSALAQLQGYTTVSDTTSFKASSANGIYASRTRFNATYGPNFAYATSIDANAVIGQGGAAASVSAVGVLISNLFNFPLIGAGYLHAVAGVQAPTSTASGNFSFAAGAWMGLAHFLGIIEFIDVNDNNEFEIGTDTVVGACALSGLDRQNYSAIAYTNDSTNGVYTATFHTLDNVFYVRAIFADQATTVNYPDGSHFVLSPNSIKFDIAINYYNPNNKNHRPGTSTGYSNATNAKLALAVDFAAASGVLAGAAALSPSGQTDLSGNTNTGTINFAGTTGSLSSQTAQFAFATSFVGKDQNGNNITATGTAIGGTLSAKALLDFGISDPIINAGFVIQAAEFFSGKAIAGIAFFGFSEIRPQLIEWDPEMTSTAVGSPTAAPGSPTTAPSPSSPSSSSTSPSSVIAPFAVLLLALLALALAY